MDNLTHTLVGLMLARTGLEKTTVRGAGMMMLAANAPDIDGVTWFMGTLPYLEYHRSYTHSFAFMPVVALLPMLLARVKFSWQSYGAALIGVLSHLLVDWLNPYGTRLLLPFSQQRFRLDLENLIDPFVWTAFLIAALLPLAMGAYKQTARRGLGWAAVIGMIAYQGGRATLHHQAIEMMRANTFSGAEKTVAAMPLGYDPRVWRGIAESRGQVTIAALNISQKFDPDNARTYADSADNPAIDAVRNSYQFQVFERFSQLPFWRVIPRDGGQEVSLIDLRFGTPDRPGFAAVSAFVKNGRIGIQ